MQKLTTLARLAAATVIAAGALTSSVSTASAGVPDTDGDSVSPNFGYWTVQNTDANGLYELATPDVNGKITGALPNGTSVEVICQVNGTADPYDNLPYTVWDKLDNGSYIYDGKFVSSPGDGYHPVLQNCNGGPAPLTTAISIPNLAIGGISVYGYTAGPIFNDGPGFTNAARAESLSTAEASGYCQDLVLANTDFGFLMPDINNVAKWPQDAAANGRSVSSTPVVGSVVVFNPGIHYWSAQHYWDYGSGHVAVVVKTDSSSYTVAEFNFNLGGGGRFIMSFRRIPWPDPYANLGNGASVNAFIR